MDVITQDTLAAPEAVIRYEPSESILTEASPTILRIVFTSDVDVKLTSTEPDIPLTSVASVL